MPILKDFTCFNLVFAFFFFGVQSRSLERDVDLTVLLAELHGSQGEEEASDAVLLRFRCREAMN